MKVKAPRLSRVDVEVLKILVRLDYARALRHKMESLKTKPEDASETTIKLMNLAEDLLRYEAPLHVASSILRAKDLNFVVLPMADENYEFYSRLADTRLHLDDFQHAQGSSAIQEAINLPHFHECQTELINALSTANVVDTSQVVNMSLIPAPGGGTDGGLKN